MMPLTRRAAAIGKWAAITAALIVSGLIVSQASYSAYTSTTSNPTSNWSTGTVALTDDDSNTALFTASGLKPSSTGSKCILVTSSGSLASTVKLYGASYSTTNSLGTNINLVITQGTGATFSSCAGFTPLGSNSAVYSGTIANFATTYTNFSNGAGVWAPTGTASESHAYKFDYTVSSSAPDTTQGGTVALGFTWEAQNS